MSELYVIEASVMLNNNMIDVEKSKGNGAMNVMLCCVLVVY